MDETKRIVVEDYPVERLPAELRTQVEGSDHVTLTLETGEPASRRSISEILGAMREDRILNGDPVQRIRALRAEWDHRDELHARIRRGEAI